MSSEIFCSPLVMRLIALAIEEDIAFGDITSELAISADHRSDAVIVSREAHRVCGLPIVSMIFRALESAVRIDEIAREGFDVAAGSELLRLSGKTRDLLSAERTVLNFLQRLCGVATHTARLVEQAGKLELLDTRKTTPGWRLLEKYATSIGGARNHRRHLGELIMLKDNHLDASPLEMAELLESINRRKPTYIPVEVEVRSLSELESALRGPLDIILLDNMGNEEIEKCVTLIRNSGKDILIEVSGGISEERFAGLLKAGVHRASLGALTTGARSIDIAMDIVLPS